MVARMQVHSVVTAHKSTVPSRRRQPFHALLRPESSAVIGAMEAAPAVALRVLNRFGNFGAQPQSAGESDCPTTMPDRDAMAPGRTCDPSIAEIPGRPDPAAIVTPAATVPDIVAECAAPRVHSSNFVEEVALRSGVRVTLRPIRPEDEPAMVRFHENLSDRSVYLRYFHHIALSERVSHERMARVCSIDSNIQMVLVAETADREIAGVGGLSRTGEGEAEFALIVADAWQELGIGAALLGRLIGIGRKEGVERIYGSILADNRPMLDVCGRLGFEFGFPEDGVIEASLGLG
jgi:RimJ/RimL family protein N-acetyltransferase